MNRLLTILLLAAGTAYGQIDNPPTSVNIVDATATGRAVLTATNAAAAATAIGLGTTNDVTFNRVATTASGSLSNPAIRIGASNTGLNSVAGFLFGVSKGESVFGAGPTGFSVTPPATFITNVNVNGSLVGTGPATFSTNVTVNGSLTVGSLATTTPSTWALDAVQTNSSGATSFLLTLPDNGNVIRVTNASVIRNIANGRLGAFYYLVNQSGSSFAIDNTNGITVQGGKSLTLAPNEVATLVATGPTSVSVAARGDLTDVALGGTANTAPSQTASSASSLMTRDLVGQEFANPRNRMQTTYWFGLEGLGGWGAVNSATAVVAHRGPRFGPSLAFYAPSRSAVSAAGVGLRLGGTSVTGSGAWAAADGGAFTMQTQVVNYYAPPSANLAFAFLLGSGDNTNFWGSTNSIGLYCVGQPTNAWAASTAFVQHTRIAVSNVVWTVSTAGTTDTNQPTWTDLINSTVTNGTAVFRNLGPHTSNNWVLATGGTNASQIVMTNTGKSNWIITSQGEALLKLRYGTNTSAPFTFFATVSDGNGESAEVSLATATGSARLNPQYWLRHDSTNAALGNDAAGIRYFSIDAATTPLTSP